MKNPHYQILLSSRKTAGRQQDLIVQILHDLGVLDLAQIDLPIDSKLFEHFYTFL